MLLCTALSVESRLKQRVARSTSGTGQTGIAVRVAAAFAALDEMLPLVGPYKETLGLVKRILFEATYAADPVRIGFSMNEETEC